MGAPKKKRKGIITIDDMALNISLKFPIFDGKYFLILIYISLSFKMDIQDSIKLNWIQYVYSL